MFSLFDNLAIHSMDNFDNQNKKDSNRKKNGKEKRKTNRQIQSTQDKPSLNDHNHALGRLDSKLHTIQTTQFMLLKVL